MLTPEEIQQGRANWAQMPQDMREFFSACVAAGLTDNTPASPDDGRRALANSVVAVHPDRLPVGDGVQPCVPSRAERETLETIRRRSKRA